MSQALKDQLVQVMDCKFCGVVPQLTETCPCEQETHVAHLGEATVWKRCATCVSSSCVSESFLLKFCVMTPWVFFEHISWAFPDPVWHGSHEEQSRHVFWKRCVVSSRTSACLRCSCGTVCGWWPTGIQSAGEKDMTSKGSRGLTTEQGFWVNMLGAYVDDFVIPVDDSTSEGSGALASVMDVHDWGPWETAAFYTVWCSDPSEL